MRESNKIRYVDYFCTQDDHHFSQRIRTSWPNPPGSGSTELVNGFYVPVWGREMVKLRVQFLNKHERLALKVHYDEGYSEVWTTAKSTRFKINQIVIPNFEDIEKLKNKIRTILVFM